MASVQKDQHGSPRIQFTISGSRRTLYLGSAYSMHDAKLVAGHIDSLLAAHHGLLTVPTVTLNWLKACSPSLKAKLQRVGLADDEGTRTVPRLQEWTDEFMARFKGSDRTRIYLRQVVKLLVDYFGPKKRLDAVTVGDAEQFVLSLAKKRVSKTRGSKTRGSNTIRRLTGRCKQIWNSAIRHERITKNPFGNLVSNVRPNRERDFFVEPELFAKLLTGCRDEEWKTLLTLSRYGALRTPSETNALTWGDIDFETEWIRVSNVKTATTSGQSFRLVPLFPEVAAALGRLTPGKPTDHVIKKHRGENLRQELGRIAKRAGIELWKKPFQNMRMSRASELSKKYQPHVAAGWCGHSELIAKSFYWREMKEDHEEAVGRKKRKADQVTHSVTHGSASFDPSLSKPWSWTYDIPRGNFSTPGIMIRVPKELIPPTGIRTA